MLITRTEEILLLVVCKLQDDASGKRIREEVEAVTGKQHSIGGIYVPLDRLVQKGLLTAREQGPTPERGGRRKRLYRCTAMGLGALREVKRLEQAAWSGLPDGISTKLGLA